MSRCVFGRRRKAFIALLAVAIGLTAAAPGAWAKKKSHDHAACADSDDDDKPDFPWQRFSNHNTCVEFTNTLTFAYQNLLRSSGGLPLPARTGTASSDNPVVKSFTYEPSLDTTTPTALGDLETTLDLSIKRSSDDTTLKGTLSEGTVALAGVTVGYTDSVMNFWDGDFQSSANVPSRTVGVVRYEHEIFENSKLGLSLETGVPTSSPSDKLFAPIYPDDPVLAVRWLYETDPLTVQVSGMMHRLKYGGESDIRIPRLANRTGRVDGWAATAGATVALPFINDDDEASMQATYAVNASPYLGTNMDLSTLASVIPFKVDTRGWSAVVSYHHAWSDQWESNVFVSRLALDISVLGAYPTVRTTRWGANVKWSPVSYITVGAELGYQDTRVEPNGTIGILNGNSGQQLTGYLFAEFDF